MRRLTRLRSYRIGRCPLDVLEVGHKLRQCVILQQALIGSDIQSVILEGKVVNLRIGGICGWVGVSIILVRRGSVGSKEDVHLDGSRHPRRGVATVLRLVTITKGVSSQRRDVRSVAIVASAERGDGPFGSPRECRRKTGVDKKIGRVTMRS